MRGIAVAGLLCVAVTTATAQPTKQGQQIASQGVAACISCHGAKGEGLGGFPRLGSAGQAYLLAQLDAFAGGSRKNPFMQPIAQNLTSVPSQAVVAYLFA